MLSSESSAEESPDTIKQKGKRKAGEFVGINKGRGRKKGGCEFSEEQSSETDKVSEEHSPDTTKEKEGDEKKKALYIVMQLCPETLETRLREGLDDQTLQKFYRQILEALQYIHSKHIIHRDLTRANVFVDVHGDIKIGDFGLAKFVDADNTLVPSSTSAGNELYKAPEVKRKPASHSTKTDMYAFGLIFLEMLHHMPSDMERVRVFADAKKGILPEDSPRLSHPRIIHLLHNLLLETPDDRPTAEEVLQMDIFENLEN